MSVIVGRVADFSDMLDSWCRRWAVAGDNRPQKGSVHVVDHGCERVVKEHESEKRNVWRRKRRGSNWRRLLVPCWQCRAILSFGRRLLRRLARGRTAWNPPVLHQPHQIILAWQI